MTVLAFAPRKPTAVLEHPHSDQWHVELIGDLRDEFDHVQLDRLRRRAFFAAPPACEWLRYLDRCRGFSVVFTYRAERWREYYREYCRPFEGAA